MKMVDRVAMEIAVGIETLRIHRGLTQQGLAERMGVTQSLVARWEDPNYRGWTFRTLRKIASALRARLRVQFVRRHAVRPEGQGQ